MIGADRRSVIAGALALAACAPAGRLTTSPAFVSPPLWGALRPGPHAVGLNVTWVTDPARPGWGGEAARPIQEWRWFPAEAGSGRDATVADLARLYVDAGQRGDLPANWAAHKEAALEAGGDPRLPPRGYETLAPLAIASRFGARPAGGRFPLVLLGQGYSYESPFHQHVLAEYLASHGYRVVTTPLVGANGAPPAIEADDFDVVVRDLAFLLERHRNSGKVAFVGSDLGGMALYALAAEAPADLVVGMDTGTIARWLVEKLFLTRPAFAFDKVRAPYLHVTRSAAENVARKLPEDLEALAKGAGPSRVLVRIPGMRHADFFAAGAIENVVPNFWGEVSGNPAASYAVLLEVVRQAVDHFLKGEGAWPPVAPAPVIIERWPG